MSGHTLLTTDSHGCCPWLWLFSQYPVPVPVPRPVSSCFPGVPNFYGDIPVWMLVQTPQKRRRLVMVASGAHVRTLHVKLKELVDTPHDPLPFRMDVNADRKKITFYSDGSLMTVVEVATFGSSKGSTHPSVPSVNTCADSREALSTLENPGRS